MPSFPDWVPSSVFLFYERLEARECVDDLHIPELETLDSYYESDNFQHGFNALRFAMESPDMEKAWRAIERRSDKVPPDLIARVIMEIPNHLSIFDVVSDKSISTAWGKLADDVDNALAKFVQATGWQPSTELSREAERARSIAANYEDVWDDMGKYVGQRFAASAKRTYLVRLLAENFLGLYGKPLYDTVASLTAVLLDEEPIKSDHVRKLVMLYFNRPSSQCSQTDPEESSS